MNGGFGEDRREHARAAHALLARSLGGSVADGEWCIGLAARRLTVYGDPGLAAQVAGLLDGWYPAASEVRAMMARVVPLMGDPPALTVIGSLAGVTGKPEG